MMVSRDTRITRPSWIVAEHYDRLGPWRPIPRAADRPEIKIVVSGYRNTAAMVEHGEGWRVKDAQIGRVALEQLWGNLALVAVTELGGDIIAKRLGTGDRIRWICCRVEGDIGRPIPGAWARTASEALGLVPDRGEL